MKFKKYISILLASFVFLANLSYSFTIHYCNDIIASVSLDANFDEPCVDVSTSCCEVEDSHDSCCSNKLFKLEKNNNSVFSKILKFETSKIAFLQSSLLVFIKKEALKTVVDAPEFYCESNAPPLYKLYSQYILYA